MAAKAKSQVAAAMQNPFSGRKMGPKVVESITLKRGADGGMHATNNHTNYDHPPETHSFKKTASKEFLSHIKKHMGIEMEEEAGEKKGKDSKAVKAEKAEDAQQQGEQ